MGSRTSVAPGIERNSLALAISGVVTAGVGLVYWIVMGRLYPPGEVGAAAAVITTATMLSAFGNLGLGAYFERFLPIAGARSVRLPIRGLAVGASVGALLGLGFLLVGPTSEMFASPAQMVLFPVVVVVLSGFALLDHISIAMQRADWAARKNIAHAVLKLLVAAGVAAVAGRLGMILGWVVTAALLSGALCVVARRALVQAARTPAAVDVDLPPWSQQWRFIAGNYGIYVASSLTPLLLPPVVIGLLGAESNAYFAIVWSLVSAVLVLMTMLMGPYVAAVSAAPEDVVSLTRRFVAILAVVAGVASLGLLTVGPLLLRLAGPGYSDAGTPLMRLAAIAIPCAVAGLAFTAICRVRRRLLPALLVQSLNAVVMLTLCALWISRDGLAGAGWAMIVAEAITTVLVAIPVARALLDRPPRRYPE
ncbi:MAG: polysaccharide biosynthesis protein [Gordonia sp.]|uniref:lipopolysaccharide biosynthesis protein n=1 Tax=Gordonia sp. (in: high G+C Gram-positive bacteria) TaxID=84139 RepID=UPI000C611970|nr:oligosaccharide flippase family protein [Gordonia sp. (in: high G+C Gram-positive bacteria)]MAU80703.1 polysaccharide biosynthesis protein [Gordonia sp. (in: high G+C Gram-positive bacteria)]